MKKAKGGGNFAVVMTAVEYQRFLDGIRMDYGSYLSMLGTLNVETSDCAGAADRECVHAGIRESVGFGELGQMVLSMMEEWMVEELRAQAAAKQEAGDEKEEMEWSCVLGDVLSQQGKHDEAVKFKERALAISRRVLSEDDRR